MAAVSAFKANRLTAMSQEENVSVTLAATSMETAVAISVIFNVLTVREFNNMIRVNLLILIILLWYTS